MDSNPPFFPITEKVEGGKKPEYIHHKGLTKRQWYAGMALAGYRLADRPAAFSCADIADDCFALADAMMAIVREESE